MDRCGWDAECGRMGLCTVTDTGSCRAGSDYDCEQSLACIDDGRCAARGGVCVAPRRGRPTNVRIRDIQGAIFGGRGVNVRFWDIQGATSGRSGGECPVLGHSGANLLKPRCRFPDEPALPGTKSVHHVPGTGRSPSPGLHRSGDRPPVMSAEAAPAAPAATTPAPGAAGGRCGTRTRVQRLPRGHSGGADRGACQGHRHHDRQGG